jgi:Fe/S biogenesis protein NfuA
MIKITENAIKKFKEAASGEGREGHALRIIVTDGGTIMPRFGLDFVGPDDGREDDVVIDGGEVEIRVDPESAKFLEDASVDFVELHGQSGFRVHAPNAGVPTPTGPLAESIQRLLEDKINPGLSSHGGRVALVGIKDQTVFLQFGGGCQGCGMVKSTLKDGVEKILLGEIPEIKRVMDVTDHSSGDNPYYPSAS